MSTLVVVKSPIVTLMASDPGFAWSLATMADDRSIPCTLTPRLLSGTAIRPVPMPSSARARSPPGRPESSRRHRPPQARTSPSHPRRSGPLPLHRSSSSSAPTHCARGRRATCHRIVGVAHAVKRPRRAHSCSTCTSSPREEPLTSSPDTSWWAEEGRRRSRPASSCTPGTALPGRNKSRR